MDKETGTLLTAQIIVDGGCSRAYQFFPKTVQVNLI